ncbi:MAG: helix-turn-helix transcriptional regulator [Chitinophagales bacterium]|nr:helix-turn-helix transcriptional regulator [Chitinophagales bacterium]
MEIRRTPNKLKLFRKSTGYSQKKVARLLGLSDTSSLSKWEHGVALPGLIQVFHLSKIYQTQPQELFDDLWNQTEKEYSLLAQNPEPFNTNQSFYL